VSIVSNSSALINLARIGKLDLLQQLYGELIVPDAVWKEVVVEGSGQSGADDIKRAAWIKTLTVRNTSKGKTQDLTPEKPRHRFSPS